MILTTTDGVPGRNISEVLGIVRGSFMFGAATMLSSFTDERTVRKMVDQVVEVEEKATEMMREKAAAMGADAIIGVRLSNSTFEYDNQLKYQVTVFGTAVKLS